ncbi:aliphatic nitrilase [Fusarium sp. NRRL 52700]|nr:aliphatic nitrilase [Fusarium sp. NRRL 52700]
MSKSLKVAAIQAEPVWNDLQGSVNKSIGLIQEAAKNGANVIGFPEVFIPGYPWSIWANSPTKNAPWINEGTLYIAQSFIDEIGTIVLHRRKIKLTHVERAIYGDGQGESLTNVADTKFGRVAGLNCWEHTQTLLRYYEYSQDVDIHVSSWPSIFPRNVPEWPYHITPECCKAFSHVVSMEGACFVLLASQIMTEENHKKANVDGYDYTKKSGGGFSMIFSTFGEELVKPLAPNEKGILYADINLEEKYKAKQNLDIVGHCSRPDQLSLRVNKHAAKPVFFANDLPVAQSRAHGILPLRTN